MEGQELGISFCLALIVENKDTEVAVETTSILIFFIYIDSFSLHSPSLLLMMCTTVSAIVCFNDVYHC